MKVLRPNYIYATHRVVDSIEEPRNYGFFLTNPFNLKTQPRILIFFDSKQLTSEITKHPDSQLPPEYRGTGIVRHYHSGMSDLYLQITHDEFTKDEGRCNILCATAGESVVRVQMYFILSPLMSSRVLISRMLGLFVMLASQAT